MKSGSESEELLKIQTENRHLRETIVSLRGELEKKEIECEERAQKAMASANSEIAQIKATISALRDEMERMKFEKAEII